MKTIELRILTSLDKAGANEVEAFLKRLGQAQPKSSGDGLAKPFKATGDAAVKAERDVLRYASAMASAQKATGDLAGASETWASALKQITPGTIEAHRATAQLATAQKALQKDLAGGGSLAQEFGASLKSSLLGIVGPAALVAGGFAAVSKAIDVTKDAFNLKAQLDATTASINAQLTGVRDTSQVYAQASTFAREFKLTQQETTEAISSSIGVMRASKAPVEDILSVLARMQVLSPEQSLQEAAIALKALASGDTTSLVTRFEVGRDKANEMKAAIAGGADAVQVMSQFLNDSGIGMDALKAKAEGAAGAIKDAAIQSEKFQLALAGKSGGLGQDLLGFKTNILKELTAILSGDFSEIETRNKANAAAQEAYNAALEQGKTDAEAYAIAQQVIAQVTAQAQAETDKQAQSTLYSTTAYNAQMQAIYASEQATAANSVALVENTQKSLDAALEAERLAAFQATLADLGSAVAGGLMTAGNAAAILASQYSIATSEAYALVAAQAALGQAKVNAQALSDQRAGERSGGAVKTFDEATRIADAERRRAREAETEAKAQLQADLAIARAKGDQAGQVALLRQQQAGLIAGSAEYKNIEAQILGLQRQGGRAGRGGGGVRVSQAQQTATKLTDIERQGGNKLAEIDEQTHAKLLSIEQKYAAQRAAAARQLADDIARANASTNFEQQLNDFDQFAKDLSDEQRAALADREAAEADYNAKVAQYQQEARDQAATGDAKLAEEILAARTKQAEQEKEIAEKAAAARRAGGDAAAVAREAQQATEAARQQAETDIAIARAKAAERAGAEQAEKDAVVAAANEQKDKVIAAAQEQADRVKGASSDQKAAVLSSLRAQADAADAWADTMVDAARRAQGAMGGVQGPPAPAPGVGEEGGVGGEDSAPGPQTQSLRAQGLRTAGAGGDSITSAIQTLNDAAEVIKVLKPFVASNKGAVKLLNEYSLTVKSAVSSLIAIQDLRARLVAPQPVLDPAQVERLKADVEYVVKTMVAVDVSATNKVRVLAKYLELEKAAVDILNTVLELRNQLAAPTPPIDQAYVRELVAESAMVAGSVLGQIPRMVQREIDLLKQYRDSSAAAISIINDTADLAKTLSEPQPAIPAGSIRRLAEVTAQTTRVILALLVPLMESETKALMQYRDGALAAAEVITETAELPKLLAEPKPAIPPGSIKKLAELARQVLRVVTAIMEPTAEETAAAMERYTSTAGAAISLIKEAAELPDILSKARPAVGAGAIKAIAADAKRITQTVLGELVPVGEEQSEAAQRYADAVGASVGVLKDTLGLTSNLFVDYRSPTDAQIGMVAKDADRIVKVMNAAAAIYSTEGLEATKAYGESLGAVFSAFKEQLLFAQALQSGDFLLDKKRLAQFEAGGMQLIAVAGRLGSQAAALPAGNLAALNAVSETITAQSDMWLKLASVPFGNLGALASSAGTAPGGGVIIMPGAITVNTLPGQDAYQIANIVLSQLNQRVAARRS